MSYAAQCTGGRARREVPPRCTTHRSPARRRWAIRLAQRRRPDRRELANMPQLETLFHTSVVYLTAPATPDRSTSPDLWAMFVAVAVVVGFVAAVQQLVSWLSRRRLRRAETRLLEVAAAQLDAEESQQAAKEARARVEELLEHRRVLQREIERRIPQEARRVYLENRMLQLASSLRSTYAEYQSAGAEISKIQSDFDPLEDDVRAGVRTLVDRNLRSHSRLELATVLLLAALFFVLLLPIDPQQYIYEWFAHIYFADQLSSGGLVELALANTLVAALAWWVASKLLLPANRQSVGRPFKPSAMVWRGAAGALIVGYGLFFAFRSRVSATYLEACGFSTGRDIGCYNVDVDTERLVQEAGLILAFVGSGILLFVAVSALVRRATPRLGALISGTARRGPRKTRR